MSNYPHWMKQAPIEGASVTGESRWRVWNRSGGATVKGSVYAFDLTMSTTSTTETDPVTGNLLSAVTNFNWQGDSSSAWSNIVLPATAILRQGVYCVAEEAVADNASLMVTVVGDVTITTVAYTAVDGTVVTPGSVLIPTASSANPTHTNATTSTNKVIALTRASASVTSNTLSSVPVIFNGWGFGL